MANPANVLSATTFAKYSVARTLTTSNVNDVSADSSNYSYTVNSLIAHNYSSSQQTVTVLLTMGSGATFYLANAVALPSKASLVLLSKENPLYLYYTTAAANEVRKIGMYAGANSSVNAHYSVEYNNG